jgi:hypothetical protein
MGRERAKLTRVDPPLMGLGWAVNNCSRQEQVNTGKH